MQISRKGLNSHIQKEIFSLFYQLLADIKDPKEAEIFLSSLLTETEVFALTKRVAVAYYLEHGRSYENIKQNLKVSSATIASIDKQRKDPGFRLALKKIEANEWAEKWAKKIKRFFR